MKKTNRKNTLRISFHLTKQGVVHRIYSQSFFYYNDWLWVESNHQKTNKTNKESHKQTHPSSPYTNNKHRRNKTVSKLIKENNIDEFLTEYSNIIFSVIFLSVFRVHDMYWLCASMSNHVCFHSH